MDATPFFIMGTLFGSCATLAIQWFANRKVRKAMHSLQAVSTKPDEEVLFQQREAAEMRRRLAVVEQIVTDRPQRLLHEIDALR
ncbi:hypothetical protein [Sphingomonas sp. BAUL-RG-20F-R05-02]|uniref:hypothetical protein n=1 Tax=Sphingomonas sp. BAUL-RG-20F-R05-02 TaxID=2914830 RepID=UPI001F570D99|nr:hypothetical protein [Sphingomonas sp. BAUL-RG-20F-R05-02]